jgi:hypothetical protein
MPQCDATAEVASTSSRVCPGSRKLAGKLRATSGMYRRFYIHLFTPQVARLACSSYLMDLSALSHPSHPGAHSSTSCPLNMRAMASDMQSVTRCVGPKFDYSLVSRTDVLNQCCGKYRPVWLCLQPQLDISATSACLRLIILLLPDCTRFRHLWTVCFALHARRSCTRPRTVTARIRSPTREPARVLPRLPGGAVLLRTATVKSLTAKHRRQLNACSDLVQLAVLTSLQASTLPRRVHVAAVVSSRVPWTTPLPDSRGHAALPFNRIPDPS